MMRSTRCTLRYVQNVLGLLKGQNIATGKVLDVYNNNVTDLKQSARVLGFEDVSIRLASRFASLDQRLLGDRMGWCNPSCAVG